MQKKRRKTELQYRSRTSSVSPSRGQSSSPTRRPSRRAASSSETPFTGSCSRQVEVENLTSSQVAPLFGGSRGTGATRLTNTSPLTSFERIGAKIRRTIRQKRPLPVILLLLRLTHHQPSGRLISCNCLLQFPFALMLSPTRRKQKIQG